MRSNGDWTSVYSFIRITGKAGARSCDPWIVSSSVLANTLPPPLVLRNKVDLVPLACEDVVIINKNEVICIFHKFSELIQ